MLPHRHRGIRHDDLVVQGAGKRAGSRRAPKKKAQFRFDVLLYALGVLVLVVTWAGLVAAAVAFGRVARGGQTGSWILLGLSSVGAVACLFVGMMLVVRLLRSLGIITRPDGSSGARIDELPPVSTDTEIIRAAAARRAKR